ncbi:Abortive infection protein [Candidatus Koribacter versatilis Ellin345]|uniref:Abortive infection protein n=1 Tax=Koribacter versatilis (strain Ellin345) TaxID=204669 RepID=Q1ILM4_KORVE|nr:type II CAAX endopeptidase family protein [Candidatus Koribacter versatilis]ABF42226.1 Abortive infection protein [Candidatus Koribacter versatilis Ellin345]
MDPQFPPDQPIEISPQSPTLDPVLAPPPPPRTNAFIGPNGLRAGWKWLIFFLIFCALIFGMAMVVRLFIPRYTPNDRNLKVMFAFEVIQAACVLLATGIMAKLIDKKKWGYFGLPLSRAFNIEFWYGAIVGFGALAVQLEIMHLGGWFDFGPVVLHGATALKFGLFWGAFFLCVGLFEEGFLRGYPQRVLTNGMGFWPSALLLSLLFAGLHVGNKGENPFGIFMVFVDGMVMCFTLWRTGTMWFAVGNHAAWDWAQTYFFGTPDSGMKPIGALLSPSFHGPTLLSGGNAGPEGSVLVLLSETLIAVSVAVVYRERKYPLQEDEAPAQPSPEITPTIAPSAFPTA